ncbi:MAG: reverse transcriptase domain-containing protein, partial [Pseudomonadota bacterium]
MIRALYSDTESAVRWGGDTSEYFPVKAGVRQGCVLAPSLFSACMDHVMERAIRRGIGGVSFANERFTDLDFADDAVIFAETESDLAAFLDALGQEAESLGLRISWAKTKIIRFARDTVDRACSVAAGTGELVEVVDVFPYLGALVASDGTSQKEVDRRLGSGWG